MHCSHRLGAGWAGKWLGSVLFWNKTMRIAAGWIILAAHNQLWVYERYMQVKVPLMLAWISIRCVLLWFFFLNRSLHNEYYLPHKKTNENNNLQYYFTTIFPLQHFRKTNTQKHSWWLNCGFYTFSRPLCLTSEIREVNNIQEHICL